MVKDGEQNDDDPNKERNQDDIEREAAEEAERVKHQEAQNEKEKLIKKKMAERLSDAFNLKSNLIGESTKSSSSNVNKKIMRKLSN